MGEQGILGKAQSRLILESVLLGIVGGLAAQLFMWMLRAADSVFSVGIAGYSAPRLSAEGGRLVETVGAHGLWLIPVATTVGGLVSGVLVYALAPEAEGDGTDTVVKAFHRAAGYLRIRVAPLKMVTSAITIGSGGCAGREGPIALISAGVGSIYGSAFHRSEEERGMLVLIGMAAGLSAIFRSPIGTALFAIEVLYSDMEFDARALLYCMLGAVVAYAVNGLFVGYLPLFQIPADLWIPGFFEYGWYILLGILAGAVATLLPVVFYHTRDGFARLPVPAHLKPAIGGLGIGLLALWLPQVLGGGYGWIQQAIDGMLPLKLLLCLTVAKIVALALSLASGGSGGVFAPSLFVGAMLGGSMARLCHLPPAAPTIVGMAAVFAGAGRVPIATMLMVAEMTGGYHLLVPAALSVVLSYMTEVTLSRSLRYQTLYGAQVFGRADSPAHRKEHMVSALRLLGEKPGSLPPVVRDAKLRGLLASGIPVTLPDGKQLVMGVVRPESPLVGMKISGSLPPELDGEVKILAAFREGRTYLPYSNFALEGGDQMLVVAPSAARERLGKLFAPILA